MKYTTEQLNNEFFCIVNRDDVLLSAIISSYVFIEGKYTLMFEFPMATTEKDDFDEDIEDEHVITRSRSKIFNIKLKNILNRIGGCKYLILAGLTSNQKSFLSFLDDYNVIELTTIEEADVLLGCIVQKENSVLCSKEDILLGLFNASKNNAVLKIDDNAPKIVCQNSSVGGLIVIENIEKVSTVIAVNYALASYADIAVVAPPEITARGIKNLIEKWQDGDVNAFNDLSAAIYSCVEDINFVLYNYATFFTIGAPYSLVLNNVIPFSHVHFYRNPDFLIFNTFYFESHERTNAAVVFSPKEFKDEEIDHIIKTMQKNNYFVKELLGKDASVYQIDNHVKEFPFDLLHVCSHGGEAWGYSVKKQFTDRNGDVHVIEFDEVVSFAPSGKESLIPVTIKMMPRIFNDLVWGSTAFVNKKFPHYIFTDMHKELKNIEAKDRRRKEIIPYSSVIKCSDFHYQGMFNILAACHSPVIFNNTCWSWSDIANSFLEVGARFYIGTLWDVDNIVAKKTAELFYDYISSETIVNSLYKSLEYTKGNKNENIYIMWGLPFTTLMADMSIENSKKHVAELMLNSLSIWRSKIENSTKKKSSDAIESLIKWNAHQLTDHFYDETLAILKERNKHN